MRTAEGSTRKCETWRHASPVFSACERPQRLAHRPVPSLILACSQLLRQEPQLSALLKQSSETAASLVPHAPAAASSLLLRRLLLARRKVSSRCLHCDSARADFETHPPAVRASGLATAMLQPQRSTKGFGSWFSILESARELCQVLPPSIAPSYYLA